MGPGICICSSSLGVTTRTTVPPCSAASMGAVDLVLGSCIRCSHCTMVPGVYLTYLPLSSCTFQSIFSPCPCSAQEAAQVVRQWSWPGRMCCSGAEGSVDPGRGREVEAKQRLQRWREEGPHCPIPSSCSPFPSSSPDPNKSGASQPGWRLSKVFCPHCLAIVLLKCDEKAPEVPSYLPRKRGLVSREQSPQTFCHGKHHGSELLPCLP